MSKSLKCLYVALAVLLVSSIPVVKSAFGELVAGWVTSENKATPSTIIADFRASIPVGRFRHDSRCSLGRPISDLPAHVPSEAGKITLFADCAFGSADPPDKFLKGIPVYFINRSGRDMSVPHQDGDIFLKLEMLQPDGKWVRCQPHVFSLCGNSYDPRPPLKNGHFYSVIGYQPRSGRPAQLRYAIHSPGFGKISNEFPGWYSTDDLNMARYDQMALSKADASFLMDCLTCRFHPTLLSMNLDELRMDAAHVLTSGKFPANEAWECISAVRRFDATMFSGVTKNMLATRHEAYAK